MGLLDDAIREHLELKRRRGADPAEVARAEQEALGPVRRERDPAPAVAEDQHADAPHDVAPAGVGEDAFGDAAYRDEPAAGPAPDLDEDRTRVIRPDDAEHPAAAQEPPAPAAAPDPRESDVVHQPTTEFRVEDLDDEPVPPASAPQPPAREQERNAPPPPAPAGEAGHAPQPPAPAAPQRDAERAPDYDDVHEDPAPEPPRGSDEDVLEETPDFLQETPEHDRLWFEQRPPRDFDFDD